MLRLADLEDLDFILSLQELEEFHKLIGADTRDTLAAYLGDSSFDILIWVAKGEPQGFAILGDLEHPAQRVELRRLALRPEAFGEGKEFIDAVLEYVLAGLKANRLYLDVAADNDRARRAYERAGMIYEGRLHEHWRRRTGDLVDLALYAMLRDEWVDLQKKR